MARVHMNGRVYDSEIGRFLSADPFVQFPESTQGFNRYSYVDNNPLSYSNPSGFLKFREALGMFVQVAFTAILPELAPLWGAIGGAISGGARGAAFGFMTAGFGIAAAGIKDVFVQAIVQGVVGGALTSAMGGRFGSGFLAGFAGSLAGSAMRGSKLGSLQGAGGRVARITIRAVVGREAIGALNERLAEISGF